jgi:hypothetical protein
VLYCGCAVLYGCVQYYTTVAVLYGDGNWLNCSAACPVIIFSCTLYAFDVLSRIKSIVLQSLSLWPTNMEKLQYELFGTVWYFCIMDQ